MAAITTTGVSRRFGAVEALRDVSLEVPTGAVTGLLGHNGAGKTTLVRVLTGLLRPHGGELEVLGLDPVADGRELRRRTGVLAEAPGLDELLTVRENLGVAAGLHDLAVPDADRRIDTVLDDLDLLEHRDRRARGLSAGLRQRVALARAIVHEPDLLFLDEPATNMDPVASRGVRELMRSWAHEHGRTVVVCTHDLREAAAACDRVAILEHGRVLATGSPDELAQRVGERPGVRVSTTVEACPDAMAAVEAAGLTATADRTTTAQVSLRVPDVQPGDVPRVVELLVAHGVPVLSVVPTMATLEDAYVALHESEVVSASGPDAARSDGGVSASGSDAARHREQATS